VKELLWDGPEKLYNMGISGKYTDQETEEEQKISHQSGRADLWGRRRDIQAIGPVSTA
jgi:hypothetical protein